MISKPNPDWEKKDVVIKNDRLLIDGYQVMMRWETPYMHKMAEMLHAHSNNNILEVGFGMGISATKLQHLGLKTHTIIEPHPKIYNLALKWKRHYPKSNIMLINDYWQNIRDLLPKYDGIFFDTFSATTEEADLKRFDFFKTASEKLLKSNGALTFYYMKKNLELNYQDELLKSFSKIIIEPQELKSSPDCVYASVDKYVISILAIK
ncbi:class I SAM-dependent methyltransferase [Candidatus Woesearchaeota archaeon]|nr:class I SAM-dependent methyltransferase [Candidatus Woesearchaeota archaeon]